MDIGTEAEQRRARFEALYAEAKQSLSYAANQVRALTEQARQLRDGTERRPAASRPPWPASS